jgi:alpha-1,3-mannosyltransferase
VKVLQITPSYWPIVGGIEKVVQGLTTALASRSIEVGIAHVSPCHASFALERVGDIEVFRIPLHGNRLAGIAPALQRLLGRYDVLHAHDPQVLGITLNLLLRRTPAVLSSHGGFRHTTRYSHIKSAYERTLLKPMLRRYSRILAVSSSDAGYFERFHPEVVLAPNGVDVERFGAALPRDSFDPRRWLYWGRIAAHKRIDLLIDLVAELRRLGVEVHLSIAGPDSEGLRQGLTAQVAALGVDDRIEFSDAPQEDALMDLIRGNSVFISASEYEGFGLTTIEAMAAGLVPVVRNAPPMSGFIEDGMSGLLLDFDDIALAAAKLLRLINACGGHLEALSATAVDRAHHYAWKNSTDVFVEAYASAIARRSASGPRVRAAIVRPQA